MKKINIVEILKNGFQTIIDNPKLILIGLIASLITPLFEIYKAKTQVAFLFIIHFLVSSFCIGLVIKFVYELRNKKPNIIEVFRFILGKYGLLLVVFMLYGIISLVGFVALIIPGIFLSVKLLLCDYGILLENEGVGSSIKRSWNITKGNWWRLFFLIIISLLPIAILIAVNGLFPQPIRAIVSFIVAGFYFAWYQTMGILVYLELRENFIQIK